MESVAGGGMNGQHCPPECDATPPVAESAVAVAAGDNNSGSSSWTYINVALLQNIEYPSAQAAVIAKCALHAAERYYRIFFEADDVQGAVNPGPCTPALRDVVLSSSLSDDCSTTSSTRTECLHCRNAASSLVQGHVASCNNCLHDGEEKARSMCASVVGGEVQDTAYHTFFPPPLTRERRYAVMMAILGSAPRFFHDWRWHKAEGYHLLCQRSLCELGAPPSAPAVPLCPTVCESSSPCSFMRDQFMYSIPASHHGPEYFVRTAEDGVKKLIIVMMGLPARGKTFLAQKICRLLGWHGTKAKVHNVQVAWRRVLLDWAATHAPPAGAPSHVCAENFRRLLCEPDSAERRLYRYVLRCFSEDCRTFFNEGGAVVVINDDFITEELRQEAESFFRPLTSQLFYMEVMRPAHKNRRFDAFKVRDPVEYPTEHVSYVCAKRDFDERVALLERLYDPLDSPAAPPSRSYVRIYDSNTIETHGLTGYLASRIIFYVMNLSQIKIRHPIYFVRHGESCYNLEDRIGGNSFLTDQGMRDAAALLEFVASLKSHLYHIDHAKHHDPQSTQDVAGAPPASATPRLEIWTSQLRRAIQTAELSERILDIRTLRWSSLNEIHAGVCEGLTYQEVRQRYPLIDKFRRLSKYAFRYPEGESYQDLVLRLEPVIMELENADKVIVVVAHQAVLRCLLAYFGSTSAESSVRVKVPHRTVWRCTYDPKGIASLQELKLDNTEAGLPVEKDAVTRAAAAAAAHPPGNTCGASQEDKPTATKRQKK